MLRTTASGNQSEASEQGAVNWLWLLLMIGAVAVWGLAKCWWSIVLWVRGR